jgi:hypothetical protein
VRGDAHDVRPLGLLGEVLGKGGAVVDLAARLGERLALLQGHDQGEVFLVLAHQLEPAAQDVAALLRQQRGPAGEGLVGGIDGVARRVVPALRIPCDVVGDGVPGLELRILRQVGDPRAGLQEAFAAVEILLSGDHLQQGRLAGAVAPHEAGTLAGRQGQVEIGEQRRGAEGKARVLQGDEGRGHSYLIPRSFLISS